MTTHLSVERNKIYSNFVLSKWGFFVFTFSGNKFSEELTVIFNNLSGCPRYSKQELNLGWNKIHGILPEFLMFFEVGNIGPIKESIKGWSSKITSKCKLFALTDALSNISLSGNLPLIINNLSRYIGYSLAELDLGMNQMALCQTLSQCSHL